LIQPRPYQEEALESLHHHVCTHDSNPCVVIPTGGGKSLMMAWAIQRWKAEYPRFRVCILAHRKELVKQNAEELKEIWPDGDIGIYSAGLKQRDEDNSVLYASIDSIYKKWGNFAPFDCLIVDEGHRIPAKGEGKYRKFIDGCRVLNKNLRVVGFTATAYRMGCGPICHKDHILNHICYEANIGDLIRDGYLCRLRSKVGDEQPDLEAVRRNSGGDYIVKSLAEAVDKKDVIASAVQSAMRIIIAEERKNIIFFCVDVSHCKAVSKELVNYGLNAPVVTANTPPKDRDRIAEQFKAGKLKAICNINVYTEGFNAKQVDCIVLLRPTLSKGLYMQMVGRGLRTHPNKKDCLILDYACCIEEHGPVDCLEAGYVRLTECQECGDTFSRVVGECPNCGWVIPKIEMERMEAEDKKKRINDAKISNRSILGSEPEDVDVDSVTVHRHIKPGKPDSIRVQYRCGLTMYREWICLDHDGYAERKARQWWRERGFSNWETITVREALQDMFLPQWIRNKTKSITVKRLGKHSEIIGYTLRKGL